MFEKWTEFYNVKPNTPFILLINIIVNLCYFCDMHHVSEIIHTETDLGWSQRTSHARSSRLQATSEPGDLSHESSLGSSCLDHEPPWGSSTSGMKHLGFRNIQSNRKHLSVLWLKMDHSELSRFTHDPWKSRDHGELQVIPDISPPDAH